MNPTTLTTPTDRELLEKAAKAAGLSVQRSRLDDPINRDFLMNGEGVRNKGQKSYPWNPLTDDGDALRLLNRRSLTIRRDSDNTVTVAGNGVWVELSHDGTDEGINAATRRAIVRAAAACCQ